MEEALVALLLADVPLAALVGDRINWNVYPQGKVNPAIRLSLVAGGRFYTANRADGLVSSVVQMDARASTGAGALAVKRRLVELLSGKAVTQDGIAFTAFFLRAERGSAGEAGQGGPLYHVESLDFDVWWKPAT